MRRYLFLDMDGVCTSADYMFGPRRPLAEDGDYRSPYAMIDPATIPRLNAIVEPTDAEVVISSSWRLVHKLGFIANALKRHGFTGKVVGKTGYSSKGDSKTRRGLEIQDWLNAHDGGAFLVRDAAPVVSFVILDDDSDMGPLLPKLVKTTWQHGLLDEHVPLALKILEAP